MRVPPWHEQLSVEVFSYNNPAVYVVSPHHDAAYKRFIFERYTSIHNIRSALICWTGKSSATSSD